MKNKFVKKALLVGLFINIILSLTKITFGILGNSFALFSDGINATTDVLISVLMIVVLSVSIKKPDHDHHYGHEKYEGLAYFLLSLIFISSSIWIIVESIKTLLNQDVAIQTPGISTIFISCLGIVLKFFLYRYYKKIGQISQSPIISADAKNHLIDVLATSIALFGIVFSQFLSPYFDHISSIIIGLFILRLGLQIILESTAFLTDQAPGKEEVEAISKVILGIKDVLSIDDLKVRRHMTQRYVDVEIGVLHTLSLKEAHLIAERVHAKVELDFKDVLHCMVHVNPKAK